MVNGISFFIFKMRCYLSEGQENFTESQQQTDVNEKLHVNALGDTIIITLMPQYFLVLCETLSATRTFST